MAPCPRASAVVLLALTCCGGRSSLVADNSPSPPLDASSLTDAGPFARCLDCLPGVCTDAYALCMGDDACQRLYACSPLGTDATCACVDTSAAGLYLALARCLRDAACSNACSDACGGLEPVGCGGAIEAPTCDGGAIPGPDASTAQCEACAASACGSVTTDCTAGSACTSYLACEARQLATSGDLSACNDPLASGAAGAEALDVCLGTVCVTPCGF